MDSQGKVIFQGKSGPANAATTPRPYLAMSVKRVLEGCPKPDYVCGCFGGLVSTEYELMLKRILEGFAPGAVIKVCPDYCAAFSSAKDLNACCVLSGTGSIVTSLVNGSVIKSGGGGPLLGDEGSAFSIGRAALRAYVRGPVNELGCALTETIPLLFGVSDPREVVARVYRDLNPAARVALLAQTVAKDWEAEEVYARSIVRAEMDALAKLTYKHLSTHHPEELTKPLYFTGGLWNISPIFQEVFIECFREYDKNGERKFEKIERQPVYGAAFLAQQLEHEYRESKPEILWSR
jgi:N-acetylglucosamine kinase-like BadF-type ATPase